MGSFVIGRIASSVLLFFAVTLLVFVAFFVMPRNDSRFARRAPTQYRLHGGMMGEYAHYVWQFVRHGDLGRSYGTRERVTTRLIQAAPVTLSLVAGGLVVWLLMMRKICSVRMGERPMDGSSSSRTVGRVMSARPMASICCSPPNTSRPSACAAP